MNIINFIVRNKKRNLFVFLGVFLASLLIFSVGIMFSSLREYLINNVKGEIGEYHVIIKGNVSYNNDILKKEFKDGREYIVFKNVKNVYKNTDKICENMKCESVTYNDSLLSLYGVSKNGNVSNTIKKIMVFILSILSIILFFIIYNSFKVSLNNKKKEYVLLKLIGADNKNLYKLFFIESFVISLIGIFLGFIFSIILNCFLLSLVNKLLFEIFNGNLNIYIYFPFIFICVFFILLITIICSIIPFKTISKYRPLEIFRNEGVYKSRITPYKRISVWISLINYFRFKDKYKSLVICIFILVFSVNLFSLCLKYTFKCIKMYSSIPEYDLMVRMEGSTKRLEEIASDLLYSKKSVFKSCVRKENGSEILVTNLGGNEVINLVDKVDSVSGRMKRSRYLRFNNLESITINKRKFNINLTNKIPYGLKDENRLIVNFDDKNFNMVCTEYTGNLFLNTKEVGLDKYLENLVKERGLEISYLNVKKVREITNNLILCIKIFLYVLCGLISLVVMSSAVNITFANIYFRNREFASLNSIGFLPSSIKESLAFESLIVSFKGFFYALPFIFILNKYILMAIKKVFVFGKMIIGVDTLLLSFILSFLVVFISMIVSHNDLKKYSLIENIKGVD